MKIAIQSKFGYGLTAGPKAVTDTTAILNKDNWQLFYINKVRCDYPKIPSIIGAILDFFRMLIQLSTINRNSDILIQWPLYSNTIAVKVVISILKLRGIEFSLLIHDIQNLRLGQCERDVVFDNYLNGASNIIVHSDNMENYINSLGVNKPMTILTTFDYLTSDAIPERKLSSTIVYAGNLEKSSFLRDIEFSFFKNVKMNCYGIGGVSLPEGINYKGCFQPDNVSFLDGSWGLVWDGDSSYTCSGLYGNYLKYNSPHKMSLYIVAGLPLIVWTESALADYVVKNKIGFAVNSLYEIPDVLSTISKELYDEYLTNINIESNKLRKGLHLLNSIKRVN